MSLSKVIDCFAAEYPYISTDYFVITDTGIAGFSKISGITLQSNDYRPFIEGGVKGVHILAEQDKQFNTLTLEKGVGRFGMAEALGSLAIFIIVSISRRRIPRRAYAVSGAVLQKITVSDFNAETASVLISSATIAYRKIEAISLLGLVDDLLPSAGAMVSSGISAVTNEISEGAKNAQNDLIDTFKNANAEADKIESDRRLNAADDELLESGHGA